MRFRKGFLAIGLFFVILSSSTALEVKLHKMVKLSFDLYKWRYALKSGDLIVLSGDKKKIIVFDYKGNVRFQWGPDLKRSSRYIDISHDGRIFVFDSGVSVYEDIKVHYCKDGKEVWRKDLARHGRGIGKIFLSPDGSYLLAISDMETGESGIKCFDSNGRLLWHKHKDIEMLYGPEHPEIGFSSDSKYFWFQSPADGSFYLFDSNGSLLMKKKYAYGTVHGGKYIQIYDLVPSYLPMPPANELPAVGIYDITGNLISDSPGSLSDDGTKLLYSRGGRIILYEFPTLSILNEYNFDVKPEEYSKDIRFLFGIKNNILNILDTLTDATFRVPVGGKIWSVSYFGKYFIIGNLKEKKIWFYEIVF